jgi:hypothetical protein
LVEHAAQRRNLDLLSSTTMPGQAAAMISSRETSSPGWSTNMRSTSSARADVDLGQNGACISPEQTAPVEMKPIELENVGRGNPCHGLRCLLF